MTAWSGPVPLKSFIPEIRGRRLARSVFEPVGIGVEQRCEFKHTCFRDTLARRRGKAPRQFGFHSDGRNRFLAHKWVLLLVNKRKARPYRGADGPSPEDFKRVNPRNRSQRRLDESGRWSQVSSVCPV
jgi:hypothetical protein